MMSRDGLSANAMAAGGVRITNSLSQPQGTFKNILNSVIPLLQVVISLNLEIRYLVDK